MQNSQTLTDLANSAKRSQDQFNATLIEIHKQSAKEIERELTQIYSGGMKGIKSDIREVRSDMETLAEIIVRLRPTLIERLLSGTTLIALIIGTILGYSLHKLGY